MTDSRRGQLIGINHVALEVGAIEEAITFYEELFAFDLRDRTETAAFLDMGDQFLALAETSGKLAMDDHRHFGLVVDDVTVVKERLVKLGIDQLSTRSIEFHDPWGNRIQVVGYEEIQFTKAGDVMDAMGLTSLEKTDDAITELREKGITSP